MKRVEEHKNKLLEIGSESPPQAAACSRRRWTVTWRCGAPTRSSASGVWAGWGASCTSWPSPLNTRLWYVTHVNPLAITRARQLAKKRRSPPCARPAAPAPSSRRGMKYICANTPSGRSHAAPLQATPEQMRKCLHRQRIGEVLPGGKFYFATPPDVDESTPTAPHCL
jgi:hypothetical protein